MRISLNINQKLWKELDIEFLTPNDPEAQDRFLDLGLGWVQVNENPLNPTYCVVDKEKFLLSVIKYGLDFKECD